MVNINNNTIDIKGKNNQEFNEDLIEQLDDTNQKLCKVLFEFDKINRRTVMKCYNLSNTGKTKVK